MCVLSACGVAGRQCVDVDGGLSHNVSVPHLVSETLCYKRQFQIKAQNQTGKHTHCVRGWF
jgi:hypothetical protein